MAKNVVICGQNLFEDVLIEILAYLPVKSLLQFKLVSKYWCNLIKSDIFISTQSRKQEHTNLLLLRHQQSEKGFVLSFHDLNSPDLRELMKDVTTTSVVTNLRNRDRQTRLLGPSCNGLVLIVAHGDVFVCNPALRELKRLPHCPFSDPIGYYGEAFGVFVISGWGFGSTLCRTGFKVVQLQCTSKCENNAEVCRIKTHVYNSTTNSWREIGDMGTMSAIVGLPRSEVFLNGVCHWHIELSYMLDLSGGILAFDLNNDTFKQLEYPKWYKEMEVLEGAVGIHSLMKLDECLAMVWCEKVRKLAQVHEVWVMREYGVTESWTKLCEIGPQVIFRPLSFLKNDEWLLAENNDGQLVCCSLHTNEIERFQIHGVELRALIYKESLVNILN